MTVYIYTLTDPRTNEIRYVGKTINLKMRLRDHCRDGKNCHKTAWLKQLSKSGLSAKLDVIEEFPNSNDQDWQEWERWWIAYLRSIGCPLTNLDTGGVGGKKHALETRLKIARASTGRLKSEAEKQKLSNSRKGWKRPPHHLQATIDYWTGRKHKPETIQKMRMNASLRKRDSRQLAFAF